MIVNKIEEKWQKIWEENKAFDALSSKDSNKPKYYVLVMFPYPSGKVHVGHLRNYAIGDVIARFMRAKGFNVLNPIGFDAFGLPAENAAVKNGLHPANWTKENIKNMREQFKKIGLSYDWNRELLTCDPTYFKHEQQFFIELYNRNIAYQKESLVNWDPVDQTVLANEQVINGRGWRSGALVEKRYLKQWFLKITDYSEELLNELNNLTGWPDNVKLMQEKWIGKSYGARINFKLASDEKKQESLEVYSTKPETIFGTSFVAISHQHPIIKKLALDKNKEIALFIEKCNQANQKNSNSPEEKIGFITDIKLIHPFDEKISIPLVITNFVLIDYASGAIFGCPAHDERDREIALKLNLPIKQVINDDEILINSDFLNGLDIETARKKIIEEIEKNNIGKSSINYRLKDWGVSRQRYWGCPIPVIYCSDCGTLPVPEKDLPVKLPDDAFFDGKGNPLDNHPSWKYTKCPKCSKDAVRETDTFDTFFESSWYFARYCSPYANNMTERSECDYWMPVDLYIGGIEHAVLHLLYARFFTKTMQEQGYLDVKEPFQNLLTQGMVLHATYQNAKGEYFYPEEIVESEKSLRHKDTMEEITIGAIEKMSKSKKNVIDLETMLDKYGADVLRLFVLSDNPPEKDMQWSAKGLEGTKKFISKLIEFTEEFIKHRSSETNIKAEISAEDKKLQTAIHSSIKEVSNDIEHFKLNRAIARCRELFNLLQELNGKCNIYNKEALIILLQLLNPFIPHITEELKQKIDNGESLYQANWPRFDNNLIKSDIYQIAVQINGKLRAQHQFNLSDSREYIEKTIQKLPSLEKYFADKKIQKIIFVPQKIINFVIV